MLSTNIVPQTATTHELEYRIRRRLRAMPKYTEVWHMRVIQRYFRMRSNGAAEDQLDEIRRQTFVTWLEKYNAR